MVFLTLVAFVAGFHVRKDSYSSTSRTISANIDQKQSPSSSQWIPSPTQGVIVTNPSRKKSATSNRARKFEYDLSKPLVYITSHNINDLKTLLEQPSILCIDTETKPVFTKGAILPTSIMQIAVRQRFTQNESVVIIDLLDFKNAGKLLVLDNVLKPAMSDMNILKIGQNLKGDFKEVSRSYTEMTAFRTVYSILEPVELDRAINLNETRTPSLKLLTQTYLNHDLDKKQQMSDWGRRPLSWEQLHYAACDALVLLRLFDAMKFKVESVQGAHALHFLATNYSIVASTKNTTGAPSSKASIVASTKNTTGAPSSKAGKHTAKQENGRAEQQGVTIASAKNTKISSVTTDAAAQLKAELAKERREKATIIAALAEERQRNAVLMEEMEVLKRAIESHGVRNNQPFSPASPQQINVIKPNVNHRNILHSLEIFSMKHKSQGKRSFMFYNQFLRFLRTNGIP